MTEQPNISETVKAMIQAQIIATLNSAPEAIEKLVKSALSLPVDKHSGDPNKYYGDRVPYIDYIVGEEIRTATRAAVKKVIMESVPLIEAEVRKGLTADSVVAALTKSFVEAAEQEWRIRVNFEAEKQRN